MNLNELTLENLSSGWILQKITTYGMKFLTAILIIGIGFWISSKIANLVVKSLAKTDLTISLRKVIGSLISVLTKVLVILVAMNTAGIEITSFVALLGGLAVGVGMALQGSLSNLAGGILILSFRPYKVGDFVEVFDKSGVVQEISLIQTVLLTADMRTVILPNGGIFNNPITNYTKQGVRRVEIEIGISYSDDFDEVKKVLTEVFRQESLLVHERGYTLEINNFADNSVNLAMYGFVAAENYWQAKWNLNRATKKALDSNGFTIPFPQREIHIVSNKTLS